MNRFDGGRVDVFESKKKTDDLFPGVQGKLFNLYLNKEGVKPLDILVPVKNKRLNLQVMSVHQSMGGIFPCTVKFMEEDPNSFFPNDYTEPLEQFVIGGRIYQEGDEGF